MLPEGYVENYEQIAKDYAGVVSQETLEIAELIRYGLIMSSRMSDMRIIDVGCGSGHVLARQFSYNRHKLGIDISHGQCKDTARYRIGTAQADAQCLPVKDKSFDVAICTDLFEHVPDENLLVDELYRVIKDNGTLFFACPYNQDLSFYNSPEYEKKYRYVHLRSVSWLALDKAFLKFHMICELYITSHMAEQKSPYPIIFQVYIKK